MPLLRKVAPGFNYRLRGSLLNALIRFHNQWRNLRVDVTEDEAYHGKLAKGEGRSVLRVALPTVTQRGGGGSTPTIDGTGYCTSRTGSGTLRGWSKFQNRNSGDWNLRKAVRADYLYSGVKELLRWFSDAGCTAQVGTTIIQLAATVCTWDTAANVLDDVGTLETVRCGSTITTTNLAPSGIGDQGFNPGGSTTISSPSDWSRLSEKDAVSSTTCATSSGCAGAIKVFRPNIPSSWIEVILTGWDSVGAALARGTSSAGSLCKTSAGTIGSISTTSINGVVTSDVSEVAISGSTSVTRTEPLSGLTIGETYEIDIVLNRYTAGGGSLVDQLTYETITFVATGTSENLTYEVPINTDYDYEWDHAENLVLVP